MKKHKKQSSLNTNSWFNYKIFLASLIGDTIYKKIFRIYFLTVFVGGIFLFLPISLASANYAGKLNYTVNSSTFSFFDSLFIAVSAFTNTGLSTHVVSKTFSLFGQFIILLLIQFGGFGFLTIIIFVWNILKWNTTFNVEQRFLFHFERGSIRKVDSLEVVKIGFIVLLISEFIGAIILSLFFYFATPEGNEVENLKGNWLKSIWAGIFHAVSAANNAGFDILGSKSIAPYRNDTNNILSVVLLFESIIGGLGFPVFYDIYLKYKNRNRKLKRKLTLFTKISLLTYFLVGLLSVVLVLIFESYSTSTTQTLVSSASSSSSQGTSITWGKNESANKLWNAVYLTFSARSAGFSGIEDISTLSEQSQWLLIILMFIGTSPASTGGGVRTITIFLIFTKIFYTAMGYKNLSIFRRTIHQDAVFESCAVFVITCILIVIATWIISFTTKLKIVSSLFESASAFGTVGLTSSATKNTTFLGKVFLVFLMFVGQLGVTNALLSWKKFKNYEKRTQYCSESIRII